MTTDEVPLWGVTKEGIGHAIRVRTTLGSFTACGLEFEPMAKYSRKTPKAVCLECGPAIARTPAPEKKRRKAKATDQPGLFD